jgi:hypothetical protein
VLKEISDCGESPHSLAEVRFVEITGGGIPELYVRTYTGGMHCCSTEYYFTQDGGLRNVLIFNGGNHCITEVKDLNGDGRPELIADSDVFAYYDDLGFMGSPIVVLVIGWDGHRYRDQTRDYPTPARSRAQAYQAELLQLLTQPELWWLERLPEETRKWLVTSEADLRRYLATTRKQLALGYYANMLVSGEDVAARAWLLERLPGETREWLVASETDLRRRLAKSASVQMLQPPYWRSRIRATQNRELDFVGCECLRTSSISNDCP